jgi:L-cysteine/cystine lyase
VTPEEARAGFPVFERLAYLNAGTNGPLARTTVEAVKARLQADLEGGRSGTPYMDAMGDLRMRARERLAGVLGVERTSVALTYSTTDSCNVVLGGLGLGPEDEIVTTDTEHFGLLGPVHGSGAQVRVAPVGERSGDEAFDVIAALIGPRTRLLALSHVSWVTGNRLPVERLAAETGVPVLVDGAQAAGAIELDVSAFDFYTVSCQKWLCGPDTTGALYVRNPEGLRIARPSYLSQASYEETGAFVPREGAPRFDTGWTPPPSLAGLVAAIEAAPEWRYERAREMAARCRELIAERFEVVTAPEQATLVSWRVPGDAAEVAVRCSDQGVIVRGLPGTDLLRASCGYWTNDDDLERLLAAL